VDFSVTESERDLVDLCRDFAQKEIAPYRAAHLNQGSVAQSVRKIVFASLSP
jgi:hypothetical protein